MSTEEITIWHCDALCAESAPKGADGWVNTIYTHGCPAHGELIETHRAMLTHDTRGRGYREKTTWYLHCACGWKPSPYYATYNASGLRRQHLEHVHAAAARIVKHALRAERHPDDSDKGGDEA